MKRMMMLAGLALLALTGCTSYYTERGAQAQVNPAPEAGPTYRPEWEIMDKRIKAEGSAHVVLWLFTSGESKFAEVPGSKLSISPTSRAIHLAKAAATYTACEKSNADALLGVMYRYKVTDFFFTSTVECEVTGYPATMTGLKMREDQPVLVDKDKAIIRIKPWETLIDCSSKGGDTGACCK